MSVNSQTLKHSSSISKIIHHHLDNLSNTPVCSKVNFMLPTLRWFAKGFPEKKKEPPIIHLQNLALLTYAIQTNPRRVADATRPFAGIRKGYSKLGLGF